MIKIIDDVFVVVVAIDDGSDYRITSRVISISSGTLSAGTKAPISNDAGSMYPRPVYDANAQKFLISYKFSW